jgi:16S rRNA (uracil1498-N3)-methyltransferase
VFLVKLFRELTLHRAEDLGPDDFQVIPLVEHQDVGQGASKVVTLGSALHPHRIRLYHHERVFDHHVLLELYYNYGNKNKCQSLLLMKVHRFIGDFDLTQRQLLIKDPELAKQMRSVLKLGTGEQIILSTGKGQEALCELGGYGQDSISITVLEPLVNDAEPATHIILYCAILKRENFELVAQKATEVGVKEVVPVITKRTVKLNLKLDRLEKIIKEAAEQSGRAIVPILHQPKTLDEAFEHAGSHTANYFFDFSGKQLEKGTLQGPVGVFIGPEGGWDESEVQQASERGHIIMNLGKLTFRAETAAIIVSYLFS